MLATLGIEVLMLSRQGNNPGSLSRGPGCVQRSLVSLIPESQHELTIESA